MATTITDLVPAAGSDDGYYSVPATTFDTGYNDLGCDNWSAYLAADSMLIRFVLNVPRGATISNASLRLRCSHTEAGTMNLTVRAAAADDATMPTSYTDADGRTKTTANVAWQLNGVTSGSDYTSGDISTVIKEVTDRGGWASGQHLLLFVLGTASDVSGAHTSFTSRDASATLCARLTLTHEEAATFTGICVTRHFG